MERYRENSHSFRTRSPSAPAKSPFAWPGRAAFERMEAGAGAGSGAYRGRHRHRNRRLGRAARYIFEHYRAAAVEALKKSARARGWQTERKRLPHIDAQELTTKWRRRFRLRADFFTASQGAGMGLLGPRKVIKTPRGTDSPSAAPRLVSASGRTSPRRVFNGAGAYNGS